MGDDLLQALDAAEEGCAPPVDTKFEATFGYLAIAPWVSGGLIVTKSIAILLSLVRTKAWLDYYACLGSIDVGATLV